MMRLKAYRLGFAAAMLFTLAACVTPQSFEERLGTGYTTVTGIRDSAGIALDADKLSAANGDNVLKQTDTAREGLDIAKDLGPELGKDKLNTTITVLGALDAYLQNLLHQRGPQ